MARITADDFDRNRFASPEPFRRSERIETTARKVDREREEKRIERQSQIVRKDRDYEMAM